jgi:hypothetical protein
MLISSQHWVEGSQTSRRNLIRSRILQPHCGGRLPSITPPTMASIFDARSQMVSMQNSSLTGTALVIGAGCASASQGCGRVLALSPMRALGRASYSWYLWHWIGMYG